MSRHNKGFQGWKEFLKLEISQMISQAKGKGLSKDFFELVKQIGEAKSKQDSTLVRKRSMTQCSLFQHVQQDAVLREHQ